MHGDFQPLCFGLVVSDIVILDVKQQGEPIRFPRLAARPHTVGDLLQFGQILRGLECDLWHYSAAVAEVGPHWLDAEQSVQFIPVPDLILHFYCQIMDRNYIAKHGHGEVSLIE